MEQPDLGLHIAELRKAKGLTQEQLVEKCNVNVRTLQRIEAGVVVPRSYTLKMIYAVLEYEPSEADSLSERIELSGRRNKLFYILPVLLLLCLLFPFAYLKRKATSNEDAYVFNYSRGIMYMYPKGLNHYSTANMKDTAEYRAGTSFIQEYEKQIFLDGKYMTTVEEGDTVELSKKTWFRKEDISVRKYRPDTIPAFNGKDIVYIFPPIMFSTGNNENGEFYDFDGLVIRELDNKIYLNDKYQGDVGPGDTVVFISGRISIIHRK